MDGERQVQITRLLEAWQSGSEEALGDLTPLVYQELRSLAEHQMKQKAAGGTIHPNELIDAVFLSLADPASSVWQTRSLFFNIAARIMRNVLVDAARKQNSNKRKDGPKTSVETSVLFASHRAPDLVLLDDALVELDKLDPRKVRVIELKYFGGMTLEEIAAALSVSEATISRDLRSAEAWLRKYISESGDRTSGGETEMI